MWLVGAGVITPSTLTQDSSVTKFGDEYMPAINPEHFSIEPLFLSDFECTALYECCYTLLSNIRYPEMENVMWGSILSTFILAVVFFSIYNFWICSVLFNLCLLNVLFCRRGLFNQAILKYLI